MGCDCQKKEEELDRRGFLNRLILSVGALMGTVLTVPLVTAMLDPVVRHKKMVWRTVGNLDDFTEGVTKMVTYENTRMYNWGDKIAHSAAYVRREKGNKFLAFTVNCSHLGCPVRWIQKSEIFMCPCHGGVFYKDGSRAAGPPPKDLAQYSIRVVGNKVEIKTEEIPITTS